MSDISIQKSDINHLDEIASLYDQSIDWLSNRGIHQWKKGVYPTRQSALDAFTEGSLYSVFSEGELVATFILNENQPRQYQSLNWRYKTGSALVLHTLVVRWSKTGKGLGRAIMEFILMEAWERAYPSIRLDVFPDNKAAVKLYVNLGFKYAGRVFFDIKEPGYEWYDCYEKRILTVEEASETDLEEILALQKLAYISEAELNQDYNIPPLLQTLEDIRNEFRNKTILKVEAGTGIIGSVRGNRQGDTCYIGRLIVHPDFQNRGIGKLLMLDLQSRFKSCIRFELFTGKKSIKNIHFYSGLGYRIFKEESLSEKVDLVYMEK